MRLPLSLAAVDDYVTGYWVCLDSHAVSSGDENQAGLGQGIPNRVGELVCSNCISGFPCDSGKCFDAIAPHENKATGTIRSLDLVLLGKGLLGLATRNHIILLLVVVLVVAASCNVLQGSRLGAIPTAIPTNQDTAEFPPDSDPIATQPTGRPAPTGSPTNLTSESPTATEVVFGVGNELSIPYLRGLEITGSQITFEDELTPTFFYQQHLVSYISEGNKIYGLLTIPIRNRQKSGFKAIVFNHGYIPPADYKTAERYVAYVDYLARNGFVVFKIDYRGHGKSEGEPTGSYFSPGYQSTPSPP